MLQRLCYILFLGVTSTSQLSPDQTKFVSETKSVVHRSDNGSSIGKKVGVVRYHYDAAISSCQNVMLLGVGTFMSVADYDKISHAIASDQPIVVAVTDHNVDNFEKTSAIKYASLINEISYQLQELIPICRNHDPRILIGGHSASGQAAMQAWQKDLIDKATVNPLGFVGLDPYEISAKTMDESILFDLSGLFWGFMETTCLVSIEKAARAAYEITNKTARVFYAMHNEKDEREMTHCVFTDHGCGVRPFVCGSHNEFAWLYDKVAQSIHQYLKALANVIPFTVESFELPQTLDEVIDVHVNGALWLGQNDKRWTPRFRRPSSPPSPLST